MPLAQERDQALVRLQPKQRRAAAEQPGTCGLGGSGGASRAMWSGRPAEPPTRTKHRSSGGVAIRRLNSPPVGAGFRPLAGDSRLLAVAPAPGCWNWLYRAGLNPAVLTGRVGSTPTPGTGARGPSTTRSLGRPLQLRRARRRSPGPRGRARRVGRLHRRQLADARARLLGVVVERPVRHARGALAARSAGRACRSVSLTSASRSDSRHRPIMPGRVAGEGRPP